MPAETRQQMVEERRVVGLIAEVLPERQCRRQSITQDGQIARASSSGGKPCEGAGEVGQGLERGARAVTAQGVVLEPGHQR